MTRLGELADELRRHLRDDHGCFQTEHLSLTRLTWLHREAHRIRVERGERDEGVQTRSD